MFLAAFAEADIVGTCDKLDDPAAPVWSKVHLTNAEALGSTPAWPAGHTRQVSPPSSKPSGQAKRRTGGRAEHGVRTAPPRRCSRAGADRDDGPASAAGAVRRRLRPPASWRPSGLRPVRQGQGWDVCVVATVGTGLPVIAVPFPNQMLARHPAFLASVATLRAWGVRLIFDPGRHPLPVPNQGSFESAHGRISGTSRR
jgi:hypothetical protein